MSIYSDFTLSKLENGNLVVSMTPPINISQWSIEFVQTHRFGGEVPYSGVGNGYSGYVTKWASSGRGNGVSGITITNSGLGIFSIALSPADVSGIDPGSWAYMTCRYDSGVVTTLSLGYRIQPSE